jgi:hypothetical protein
MSDRERIPKRDAPFLAIQIRNIIICPLPYGLILSQGEAEPLFFQLNFRMPDGYIHHIVNLFLFYSIVLYIAQIRL